MYVLKSIKNSNSKKIREHLIRLSYNSDIKVEKVKLLINTLIVNPDLAPKIKNSYDINSPDAQ